MECVNSKRILVYARLNEITVSLSCEERNYYFAKEQTAANTSYKLYSSLKSKTNTTS